MRIGIDLHTVDGKYQGSRSHVIELFSRVIELCPELEFFLFLDDIAKLKSLAPGFRRENAHITHMPNTSPFRRLMVQLPKLARKMRLDVLHTQYIAPPVPACHSMVTIHDVLFETHPEFFPTLFRLRSSVLTRSSARKARHVFTVSHYSKRELVTRYGLREEKVSVIYNGVDTGRFRPLNEHDESRALARRGLRTRRFVLTVGRIEPRKNHANLIRAYANLGMDDIPLVIVGHREFKCQEILKLIDTLGVSDKVKIFCDVGDDELPLLYRNALVFAYPSYAEGFGMPPLEAMASGTPVMTSNTTSIPEVAGEAAFLVNPNDVAAIESGLRELLECDALRRDLVAVALNRARKFTWDKGAETVADQYRNMVS